MNFRAVWRRNRWLFLLLAPIALLFVPLWLPRWIAAQKRVELASAKTRWFRDAKSGQPICQLEYTLDSSPFSSYRPSWWKPGVLGHGDSLGATLPTFYRSNTAPSFNVTLAVRDGLGWKNLMPLSAKTAFVSSWEGHRAVLRVLFDEPIATKRQDIHAIIHIGDGKDNMKWERLVHKATQPITIEQPLKARRASLMKVNDVGWPKGLIYRTATFRIPFGTPELPIMRGLAVRDHSIQSQSGKFYVNTPKKQIFQESFSGGDAESYVMIGSDLSAIPASQGRLTLRSRFYIDAYPAQEISCVIRE